MKKKKMRKAKNKVLKTLVWCLKIVWKTADDGKKFLMCKYANNPINCEDHTHTQYDLEGTPKYKVTCHGQHIEVHTVQLYLIISILNFGNLSTINLFAAVIFTWTAITAKYYIWYWCANSGHLLLDQVNLYFYNQTHLNKDRLKLKLKINFSRLIALHNNKFPWKSNIFI